MKKGQTMRKRLLRLMKENQGEVMTSKEIADRAFHRWRWSPTVVQIAMLCRGCKQIIEVGEVDITTQFCRYRGKLWTYQELPESGE
jgi:hypothetical protein